MGWFDRFRPQKRNGQVMFLNSKEFAEVVGAGGYRRFDQNVDVKTCVHRISELISSMTLFLMQNTERGDVRVKNGLSRRLDVDPWRYGTRKTLYYKVVEDLLFNGNSILIPRFNSEGLLEELKPIEQSAVVYKPKDDGGYYIIYDKRNYQDDEIVHFVYNPGTVYPWLGESFKVYLEDILQNLKSSQNIKQDFYTKHFKPNIMFTIEAESELMQSEEGRQLVYDKWLSTPAGMPYLLPGNLISAQVVPPMSLREIAINESVELDKRTIANLFGVPPFMLGQGAYHIAEYNAFIDAIIAPIAQGIAQELTRKLILSPELYIKFNLQSIRAFAVEQRLQALYQGRALGIFSANEIRVAAGYEPLDKEEMDEFTMLENYLPSSDLGKQKKLLQGGGETYEGN